MAKTKKPTAKKPAAKPPRVTVAWVDEYLETRDQRRALQRQVDALERDEKTLGSAIFELIKTTGGKSRTVKKGKHVLRLVDAPGSVRWKDEFVRVAGPDAAAEAQADLIVVGT